MTKRAKAIIALIVSFAVILPSAALSFNFKENTEAAQPQFYSELCDIIHKYDTRLTKEEAEKPFALSRLIVSGWNGKKYGAVAVADDTAHDVTVLQFSSPEKAENAAVRMNADGMTAESDSLCYLDETEKCTLSEQNSNAMGVKSYIDNFRMSKDNVTVAVIDTGVMFDHEAISNRFYSEGVDLSGDNMTNAYYDVEERGDHYGHGTSVCGIIADNTPDNVKILPIKVVPFETDYAASSVIFAAMNYAVDSGASVISISVSGTGYIMSYEKAMNNALSKGVCVCASAGNSNLEITERYPACLNGVITVSALDEGNTQRAPYSNYGAVIDFCAPGYKINSTYPLGGESSYKSVSGTSFSTPYISALCADIKSIDSSMSKEDVYQTLCDFSVDLGESGRDNYYGNGLPFIGNMVYSGEEYTYSVPQGELNITSAKDYTEGNRPWERYAAKTTVVNVDSSVDSIGDYTFSNMSNASFNLPYNLENIGDYAFYSCDKLSSISFDTTVESIGYKAFADIEDFTINGYGNTPAEIYAASENISFNSLGCNHNYFKEVFAPEGEDKYILCTCFVCGDSTREKYKMPQPVERGICGYGVNYTLDSLGRLTIYGSGNMFDYKNRQAPWYNNRDKIRIIDIQSGILSVSPFAFYGCNEVLKIYSAADSEVFSSDNLSLFNKQGNELILCFAQGKYRLPESVDTLDATAFVAVDSIALEGNSHYSVDEYLIYDSNGNIAAALPAYRERTLKLNTPCEIKPYAFVLCEYPTRLESDIIDLSVGEYALGYIYDGELKKHDFTVKACAENGAAVYAAENGFELEAGLQKCGDNLTYSYNASSNTLIIDGCGAMTEYSSLEEIPWSNVISELTTVQIGKGVTSLSSYSFSGADGVYYLTMPLSLEAPKDNTVWGGCNAIRHLNLTLGSGAMDDYVDGSNALYTYTPWYISRATITDLSLDGRVKYIGKSAFRGCSAITHLELECVEEIGEDAFIACSKLSDVTIRSKNVILSDYCIFSYMTNVKKIYPRSKVKAYCDSTVKDYCDSLGVTLIPLGCAHSRNVTLTEEQNDGFSISSTYLCSDCGESFTEVSHYASDLKGTVKTTKGLIVENAEVSVDGVTAACDENGEFYISSLQPGEKEVSVSVNGIQLLNSDFSISEGINSVEITLRYADYVTDGVINAKDYAYALKHGFGNKELFEYGRIENGDNRITEVENEN